jgi:hypothetical protein
MADETRVALVNPDGKLVTLPEGQAREALAFGYSQPNAVQQEEVRKREEYGTGLGSEVRAGLEGAARGLTFGLSDLAMQGLGADKEGLAERKARNPYAATGGELAGVGAGLLAPVGLFGAGVRGAAAAGELASQAAGRGLAAVGAEEATGLAARALAKGAQHAAGSAVEGALYGAGQGVSEAALGDPTDAAQKILAHATAGALLGGVLGGATGVMGAVGRRTMEAMGVVSPKASPVAQAALDAGAVDATAAAEGAASGAAAGAGEAPTITQQVLRSTVGQKAKEVAAKVGSVVSGADEAALKELIDFDSAQGQALRKAAFADQAVDDQAVRTLTKHIGTAEEEALPLLEQARGKLKDEHIAKIVKTDNLDAQWQAAQETLGTLQQAVEEMKSDPATYGHVAGVNKLERYVDAYAKKLDRMVETENPSAGLFSELDNLKANLGQLARPRKGVAYSHQDFTTFDTIQNLYKTTLQPTLENQDLWGKAGELQARVNRKWTDLLYNHNLFRSEFMKQVGTKDWQEVFAANPAAVEGFLGSVGRARNDLRHELLSSHLERLSDFAREVRDAYELGGDVAAKVDRIAGAGKGAKEEIESALKTAGIRNEAKKILETRTGRGVVQFLKYEERLRQLGAERAAQAEQLAHMERAIKDIERRTDRAVDSWVSRIKDAPKLTVPASVKGMHEIYFAPREERTKHASGKENAYDQHLSEIANLVQNPERLRQRLAGTFGDLNGYAPRVSTELQLATTQALGYLYAQAPKNPYMNATVDIRRSWKPSTTELVRFERTLRAIHDPVGVLEDFAHGHISKEAADALRAVYPSIYAKMVTRLVPKIAETEGIPLQRRLELSDVLGVPLDSLTDPKMTASYQQMYAEAAQAAAPPPRPAVSKHLRAHQAQTPLQRIAQEG